MQKKEGPQTGWLSNLGLVFKMFGAILLVFTSSLALVAVLSFLKFDRVYLDTYGLRYDSVVLEAKGVIESSLGRGLTLESNTAASVAISRVAEQHGGDIDLTLHGLDGGQIASTAEAGPTDAAARVAAVAAEPTELARAMTSEAFVTSAAIRSEGETVGMVTVAFSAAPVDAARAILERRITWAAIGILLIFTPVVFLLILLAIFPSARRFAREADEMRNLTQTDGATPRIKSVLLSRAAEIKNKLDAEGRAG